jgi:dihydrofolate reductase
MPRELSLIFAVGRNGVIGRAGGLPWSYPEDREAYESLTRGHAVLMGRRTWEEFGVPLAERHNIVVSTTFAPPPGVHVARDLPSALSIAYALDPSPFVIGGATLFGAAMPLATRVYVTEVPESPEGDTTFHFDRTPFREVSRRTTASGLVFLVFERR